MDNLAHSLTGVILAHAALRPELRQKLVPKYQARLSWCAVAIVNLPDIDIVLRLLGQETYFFHHRGFTHSFFGLALMLPLSFWLFQRILGRQMQLRGDSLAWKDKFVWILTLLLVGHFFLDYLTSFGTMFLYPFSMQRFAYPLMFIIDPWFWIILACGVFLVLLRSQKTWAYSLAFGLIIGLWSVEWSFKQRAQQLAFPQEQSQSHPLILSPFLWNVLQIQEHDIQQTTVSLFGSSPKVMKYPKPQSTFYNQICPQLQTQAQAQKNFLAYKRFAQQSLCHWSTWQSKQGCLCYALRYNLMSRYERGFGRFFIPLQGQAHFIPADRLQMKRILKELL